MQNGDTKQISFDTVKRRLSENVTLVLPGWALAGAGLAFVVLLLAALD